MAIRACNLLDHLCDEGCWKSRGFLFLNFTLQKASLAKKQQGTLSKATTGAMVMSAASVGLNLLQDMNEPVFEMKFESLSPTSKVAYKLVDRETSYSQLSPR